jgi:hypothetical protein
VVGPSLDDPETLVIADLRSMQTRPLDEVAGISVPASARFTFSTPAIDGTIALDIPASAEGNLLVLGANFEDARWISLPDSLQGVSGISLSPDGANAAVVSMGGGDGDANAYRYALISTSDGALIASSDDIELVSSPSVAWVQNAEAVAYLAGPSLQKLTIGGSGEPEAIFEAGQALFSLQTTHDPDVVVFSSRRDHGSDASPNQTAQDIVYSVNVATGEVLEFPGIDASASAGWITDAGALVMYEWLDDPADVTTYTVYDPVTGQLIGDIVDAPSVQVSQRTLPTLGPDSMTVSSDGSVEVLAIGTQHLYVFTAGADGLTMERVESPAGLLSEVFLTASVYLSPDGSLLSLSGAEDEGRTRYLTSLDDPDSGWTEVPNTVVGVQGTGIITFVGAAGD